MIGVSETLPKGAKIIVDDHFTNGKMAAAEPYCKEVTITPEKVAGKFRRYHVISFQDLHDYYDFVDCGNQGRIVINKKEFYWKLYITDELETDYPDGKWKYLAGKAHPVH